MANPYTTTGRRLGLCIAAGLLLTSVGCGWTHGRYASDPMLGNFNRPIAATPPIFTGGDPGVSPAYDTGARLGMASPDVPGVQKNSDEHIFIMPTFQGGIGLGGFLKGGGGNGSSGRYSAPAPTGGGGASFSRSAAQAMHGARLPTLDSETDRSSATFVAGMVTPLPSSTVSGGKPRDVHSVLTNGSSIEVAMPKPKMDPAKEIIGNPQQIASLEEAHSALTTCGAKTQALEQIPTGEWRFVCTLGDGSDCRRYEAKHREPIEAVRAVLIQVNGEK